MSQVFRRMRSEPRLFLGVMLTLTLGLSANAVLTGLIEDLYLRPPGGIEEADRVRVLAAAIVESDRPAGGFSERGFEALEQIPGYERVAAYSGVEIDAILGRGLEARRVSAELVSGDYFRTLGVDLLAGRGIEPTDDRAESEPVVVVSHAFFRSGAFGRGAGEPSAVVHALLEVDNRTYRVIGVTPPGFTGATRRAIDLWLPLEVATPTSFPLASSPYTVRWLSLVGRLEPGAAAALADEVASARLIDSGAEENEPDRTWQVVSHSLLEHLRLEHEDQVVAIGWLSLVSIVLVVIAIVNASGFLLARSVARGTEMAVRSALGGSRWSLFGELLAEAGMVAVMAGLLSILAAAGLAHLAREALVPGLVGASAVSPWVAVSSAGLAAGGALFAALVSSTVVLRGDPCERLLHTAGSRGGSGARVRPLLLVFQVALTMVLLVSAHQFLASLRAARAIDLGVEVDDLWLVRWQRIQASPGGSESAGQTFRQELEQASALASRLARLPEVEVASMTASDPFRWSISLRIGIPGRTPEQDFGAFVRPVGSDYDRAMSLELLAGRWFDESDHRPGAATAVVGRAMAERFWPDGDALGACFYLDGPESCLEIVGVVTDVVEFDPTGDVGPTFYVPIEQGWSEPSGVLTILLRARADSPLTAQQLRVEVAQAVPDLRTVEATRYRQELAPMYRQWRLGSALFSAYGGLALVLASCGLFALLSLDVRERRFELGVRQALGATPADLAGSVLRSAIGLVALGTMLGMPAAWAARRLFEAQLFGVGAWSPSSWLSAAGVLLAAAVLASLGPLLEARRSDPSRLLRQDG